MHRGKPDYPKRVSNWGDHVNDVKKWLKIALVLLLTLFVLTFIRDIFRGNWLRILFAPLITGGGIYWMFYTWQSARKKDDENCLPNQKSQANMLSEDKSDTPQVIGPDMANQAKRDNLPQQVRRMPPQ